MLSAIVGSRIITFGLSRIGISTTTEPTAKGFYTMSCLLSGTAATTGDMAAIARKCEISEIALLTEAFGAAFLFLGNKAHAAALKVDGRRVPYRFRKPAPGFGSYNRRNTGAFIMPMPSSRLIKAIPFEQIGRSVGFAFSVYCYGKIIIKLYRYGHQLIISRRNKKFSNKLKHFICLIYIQTAFSNHRKLYFSVIT